MVGRWKLFGAKWGRARRVWVGAAIGVVALLVGGMAVLTSTDGGGSSSSSVAEPSTGGWTGAPVPGSGRSSLPADSAAAAPEPGTSGGGAAEKVPGTLPQQLPLPPGTQRSLVRTAQLSVDVDEAAAATRQVRTAAAAVGGLVVEERSGERGSFLVLRVPVDTLDRVIDDIAAIGRVTSRSSQVVDTTAEVVDLDARVASQQASVARIRTLLAQAVSIGDVVAIESELAQREADLDSLTGRLAALKDQVALSTLTIDLHMPSTVGIDDPDDRAAGFFDGLDAGWKGVVALGSATAAVLGFVLPFIPVVAVVVGMGWLARRLVRNRRVVAADAAGASGRSGPGSVGES